MTTLYTCRYCGGPATYHHGGTPINQSMCFCETHRCSMTCVSLPQTESPEIAMTITETPTETPTETETLDESAALQAFMQSWQADINTLSVKLSALAESNSWCSDYDDIIENINAGLHFRLKDRYVDATVYFEFNASATLDLSFEIEIPPHIIEESDKHDFVSEYIRRTFNYGGDPENLSVDVYSAQIDEIISSSTSEN